LDEEEGICPGGVWSDGKRMGPCCAKTCEERRAPLKAKMARIVVELFTLRELIVKPGSRLWPALTTAKQAFLQCFYKTVDSLHSLRS
jgi:hypothetical protein